MAGKSRRSKLILSDEDRAELEQLSRSRTLPHREAQRAVIILGYYSGESIASIGRRLGMTRLSVSKWVAKALAGKSRRSKLILSDEIRAELQKFSRSRTLPHRESQRAVIILGYYSGESIASIGRRLV